METYLVGGAVRDELLGKLPREKDFVVVNATPQQMLDNGFKQVGKDFPVFLHPKTQEEYALARKERKTAVGHHGFALDINSVTLEEDLLRRDLTINAMAKDDNGNIIDPYNGKQDLENRVLRHVSEAFIEDPLRVLRVARFQAMLPDFSIHPDTLKMMRDLCAQSKEIISLPKERIWNEVKKASIFPSFHLFWKTLDTCGCLHALGLSIPEHFLSNLEASDSEGTFRILSGLWHHPHPTTFLVLGPPTNIVDGIKFVHNEHDNILQAGECSIEQQLKTCQRLDPFRRPERAKNILSSLPKHIRVFWQQIIDTLVAVPLQDIISNTPSTDIAQAIFNKRLEALRHLHGNK